MTNLDFSNWGQGMQCDHQPSYRLLSISTLGSKPANSFDKPWEFITLTLNQGNIHTNTLGKYSTYFIHLYTFQPDVLNVNSQEIKGFTLWREFHSQKPSMTAVASCFQEGKPLSYKYPYVNMLGISPYCCTYNLH